MGGNKSKLNKTVLRQLEARTNRKGKKREIEK